MDAVAPAVAVRLAYEGIPVRVIARATQVSSDIIWQHLREARLAGQLLFLPRDDWPPGQPRAQRRPDRACLRERDDDTLQVVLMQLFRLTESQARIMLPLLRRHAVRRALLYEIYDARGLMHSTDIKILDIQIHHIRKRLRPFGLSIETLWGYGYCMPAADRAKALKLVARALRG